MENNETVEKSEFVKKLEEISSREFRDEEQAVKHYKSLAAYVGKKKEDFEKDVKPQVAKEFEKYTDWLKEAGVDIETVNPLSIKEYIGESHEDIAPRPASPVNNEQQLKALADRAQRGDEDAQAELVRKFYTK
ncbi:MAG: hypothetical protein WD512_17300 [Candidatus Paceibacterota bacterium]